MFNLKEDLWVSISFSLFNESINKKCMVKQYDAIQILLLNLNGTDIILPENCKRWFFLIFKSSTIVMKSCRSWRIKIKTE